jgi:hypothetical protein
VTKMPRKIIKLCSIFTFMSLIPLLAMKPEQFPAHPEDTRPRTHSELHVGDTVINIDSNPDTTTTYGTITKSNSGDNKTANTNTTKLIITHSLVALITAAISAGVTLTVYFAKCK